MNRPEHVTITAELTTLVPVLERYSFDVEQDMCRVLKDADGSKPMSRDEFVDLIDEVYAKWVEHPAMLLNFMSEVLESEDIASLAARMMEAAKIVGANKTLLFCKLSASNGLYHGLVVEVFEKYRQHFAHECTCTDKQRHEGGIRAIKRSELN